MTRHIFAVLSLAAIAIVSTFWFLLDVLGTANHSAHAFGVAAFEDRFRDFSKTVRPHTEYGYVSDISPTDQSSIAEYHLTQYTLAPAIIKRSGNTSLVIVNYHSKELDPKLLQANHLVLIQQVGTGVALCRRVAR